MQQACTQCGNLIQANSQFCTNCGATRPPVQAYRQSWEAPAQNSSQVPPWAQAQGGMYQQQQMFAPNTLNNGGSLGFGGANDTQLNKLLKIAGFSLLGGVLLFIVCIALAVVIPIPSIQTFFVIIAILLVVIPWIAFVQLRRIMRRTIGSFWRFF